MSVLVVTALLLDFYCRLQSVGPFMFEGFEIISIFVSHIHTFTY